MAIVAKEISVVIICGLANGNNSKRKYLSFLYVAWPMAIIAKENISRFYMWPGQWQ